MDHQGFQSSCSQSASYSYGTQAGNENFNEELFLKHITNYPAIYDPSRKGYSNRLFTDKAWENISKSMCKSVEICKKRWKSLREKYYREKQKLDLLTRSGAGALRKEDSIMWPHMSFFEYMLDTRQPRHTFSSVLQDNTRDNIEQTNDQQVQDNETSSVSTEPGCYNSDGDGALNLNTEFEIESLNENNNRSPYSSSKHNNLKLTSYPETSKPNNSSNTTPTSHVKRYQRGKKRNVDPLSTEEDRNKMLGILGNISTSIEKVSSSASVDKLDDFAKYLIAELRDLPVPAREEFVDQTVIRLLQLKRQHRTY